MSRKPVVPKGKAFEVPKLNLGEAIVVDSRRRETCQTTERHYPSNRYARIQLCARCGVQFDASALL